MTETEKANYILKEGFRSGIGLKDFIKRQIEEFEESQVRKDMLIGERYDLNDSDIKDKKREYIDENGRPCKATLLPNYKLKHSIPRKLRTQKEGYLLRRKMTIKQDGEDTKKNEVYIEKVKKFFNDGKHRTLKYTLGNSVKNGLAWWHVFIDEEGKLKVKLRHAKYIIPIWKDEEHETLAAIIIRYNMVVYTQKGKDIVKKVEYWDLDGVRYLVYNGVSLIEDIQQVSEKEKFNIPNKLEDGLQLFGHFLYNEQPQVWSKLPFVYWKYNSDEKSLVFYLKSLLDCYDRLSSITADSIEEAPNGVNVVKGYAGDNKKEFQKNLQTYNTVFVQGDGDYKREGVTVDVDGYKQFIQELRKDIYDYGAGVDTQSEKFATNLSGEALQQLFQNLDLDCANIETEFQSSLEYFMFFLNTYFKMTENTDYFEEDISFIFNKTMITSESSLVKDCKESIGLISRKTILAKHPFVTDPEKELEQMDQEQGQQDQNILNKLEKAKKDAELNNKNKNQDNKLNEQA